MHFHCIEIIGKGNIDFVCRVQNKTGSVFVCKKSPTPSLLTSLPQPPNILPLIDQAPNKDGWYLLFPDYQSIDLEQLQKRKNIRQFSLQISLNICNAIIHIHNNGMLHRDIKPSNIIVTKEGMVFLIDFERGYQADQHKSLIMGNKIHMAPEVIRKGLYSTASDVYALGVIMHQLIFAQQPFGEQTVHKHPLRKLMAA